METELLKTLVPILVSVVGILVSWGLAELSGYIRSKTRNENALKAMEDISALVRTTVSEVGETFKKAAADGKITSDEGRQMKALAILKVKDQIPPLVEKHALLAVNNLNDFIASRIEREVVKLKQ
uniref:Holin n=1 Tax=viral metagenome TaxID=1070528 RepID=A0A6H1ZBU4_9ZZZZ